ncbi:MAG: STAS domain-containing protein [Terriglobia bacterium]
MRITARFADDIAIISLSGKFLAGSDGPYLRQKVKDFIDAGTKKLVIDFADVPYIDSTGLGFLAGTRVTAQNAAVRMVLSNLNVHVRRILDDVKLSQFFIIAPDEAAAVAKVNEVEAATPDSPPAAAAKPRGRKAAANPTEPS